MHTQPYFWTAGKARTLDISKSGCYKWSWTLLEALELRSLRKGCVSTHFWQCKQQNPFANGWAIFVIISTFPHPYRSTNNSRLGLLCPSTSQARIILMEKKKHQRWVNRFGQRDTLPTEFCSLKIVDRFWTVASIRPLFANFFVLRGLITLEKEQTLFHLLQKEPNRLRPPPHLPRLSTPYCAPPWEL